MDNQWLSPGPNPESGIYLHIPFCEKKCIYCDFYSLERMEHMEVFISMIIKEIEHIAKNLDTAPRPATSIFFGGGTPSLLSPAQLEKIITALRNALPIKNDAEWTMECNPGTISRESLGGYKSLGINRLSFGVQSFQQSELDFLHRIHSPEQGIQAVELAMQAGFQNINIDMIFALPGQSLESWQNNLQQAIALGTEHISAYSLIFEEKTPLYTMLRKGLVKPGDEETDAAMYQMTIEKLADAGFQQYEVSNFARPGKACTHNRTYWHGKEYLAFGPSAHAYFNGRRSWNYRNLIRYLQAVQAKGNAIASYEDLTPMNKMFEMAFLSFRADGLRPQQIYQQTGIDLYEAMADTLRLWQQENLIKISPDQQIIRLTPTGYALCDELSLKVIEVLEKKAGTIWESASYEEENDTDLQTEFALPVL
jgi:oxygen-independent coproporphyrinogen-3 oxidase